MALNLAAFVIFAISAGLHLHATHITVLATVLSGIGVALVSISGYLGGVLVYDDGVAVGRHRRALDVQSQTLTVNAAPDAGWVDVMDAADLPQGVPVRADVNGHAMVLLRPRPGDICAFQEFCTHRCGPLSEGTVAEGQITCPWHRSRFDVHTGKPTHGPAKVDLKVYPVREERGRVQVSIGTS
jgi:nitrite reductase/ring-hydroxylating ferredoxin subunit